MDPLADPGQAREHRPEESHGEGDEHRHRREAGNMEHSQDLLNDEVEREGRHASQHEGPEHPLGGGAWPERRRLGRNPRDPTGRRRFGIARNGPRRDVLAGTLGQHRAEPSPTTACQMRRASGGT